MPSVFLFSDVASVPSLSWAFRAPGNHLIASLLAETVTGAFLCSVRLSERWMSADEGNHAG